MIFVTHVALSVATETQRAFSWSVPALGLRSVSNLTSVVLMSCRFLPAPRFLVHRYI
ncbi:hypothetical protein FHT76_006361 [Rhizobium sp. BK176]|nr:hypothetical protein [Rhizobium sp. BK176]